jgi:Na+-transporting NADH:ubiquinone oxidoreductase subunit C
MVIIVAALLSTTALLLKSRQDKNMTIAKIQGILAALNVQTTMEDAETLYAKFITSELVIDQDGQVAGVYRNGAMEKGTMRAFDLDLKAELHRKKMGEPFHSPLYVAEVDGKVIYIVPLRGVGLWGPLYGNIAFGEDFNEILGAAFSHDKETPGLGAEIDRQEFSNQLIGKKIFDETGRFNSILVVKGGASMLDPVLQIHGVDAISGGTITSNGVADMLKNCLENYLLYIKNNVKI